MFPNTNGVDTFRTAIFTEEPTIVIKQGRSTKTVKNGWRNDLIGKSDLQVNTTKKCLRCQDQRGEGHEAGVDVAP